MREANLPSPHGCAVEGAYRSRTGEQCFRPLSKEDLQSGWFFIKSGYAARRVLERRIFERDGSWDCFYCGGNGPSSIDHVTPRYLGGSEHVDNLVFACRACNDEKNTEPGWVFVLRKVWDFEWPDRFVRPTHEWNRYLRGAA